MYGRVNKSDTIYIIMLLGSEYNPGSKQAFESRVIPGSTAYTDSQSSSFQYNFAFGGNQATARPLVVVNSDGYGKVFDIHANPNDEQNAINQLNTL